jgi:hypothetical protein
MGAWGFGPFENDDAADWMYELNESNDFTVARTVLTRIANHAEYLEAPECSTAIAAAEVVAAAILQPSPALPEEVAAWTATHASEVTAADVTVAVAAVDRTLADDSELRDLWAEAGEIGWVDGVNDLRRRLTLGL